MYKHQHYNLWLHDGEELASIVGVPISERTTLHEWPLSCVQRLTTAHGRKLIYNSQSGPEPALEPDFYARASSGLLPWAQAVYRSETHSCMLLEFIEGPRMDNVDLDEEDAVRTGRELLSRIAEIEGELPYASDITDEARWLALVDSTLCDLRGLVEEGKFSLVTTEAIRALQTCAHSSAVIDAIAISPGLRHGDLGRDNVFLHGDAHKVIDWHPCRGPTDLDFAGFLREFGVDPSKYVHKGVLAVGCFLDVSWVTQCKKKWIQDAESYDGFIVRAAEEMRQVLV